MLWIILVFALVPMLALVLSQRDRKLERQILKVLLRYEEMYGLQIIEAIEQDFGREPGFGSVYPALRRLEREGFVNAHWGDERPVNRGSARCRFYRLTGKRFRFEARKLITHDAPFTSPANINLSVLLEDNTYLQEAYHQVVKHTLELIEQGSDL